MKNFCSNIVLCMLLLSANRVDASHDDVSQLSYDEKLAIIKQIYRNDPRILNSVSIYNINILLSNAMANQGKAPASGVFVPFKIQSKSLVSKDCVFEFDNVNDIPKEEVSQMIKGAFNVNFSALSFFRAPSLGGGELFLYPFHIKKLPLFFDESYNRSYDLSNEKEISSAKLFELFDDEKGYMDPYLVYAAVGVFASRMMEHSVKEDDMQSLHEKIVNFINLIHPLQIQSEDDIVSIKGRERDRVLLREDNGREYAIGDILHDVTVGDMMNLVVEPCLGLDSPFEDDEKIEIANALGGKGFAEIIAEKGLMPVL